MKTSRISWFIFPIFLAIATVAIAQTNAPPATPIPPPAAPVERSEADLEKLVAPIALYPDPLLATLLPASAYPIDIVEASRFIKDTNNIAKLDSQPWDPTVKELARFPEVINKMNDDISWTSDLGQAFVEDQKGVLEAIQVMRGKAQQAGSLKTTPQQVVTVTNTVTEKTVEQNVVYVTNTVVQIQPAQPQVIYVPQYNPTVVYGGYSSGDIAAASVVSFGVGMAMGAIIANNNCDWHHGGVYVGGHGGAWAGGYHGNVNVNRNVNVNQNINANRAAGANNAAGANRSAASANRSAASANRSAAGANQSAAGANRSAASANRSAASANRSAAGGANSAQKWQADPNRRTTAPSASAQSRGWEGGGGGQGAAARSSSGSGSRSAFSSGGGSSQTRASSARGSASRGGGGGRGGGRR